MRWSIILMVVGVLIILLGLVPIAASGFSALQGTVSLFATGLLVLLVGFMLRKVHKSFE